MSHQRDHKPLHPERSRARLVLCGSLQTVRQGVDLLRNAPGFRAPIGAVIFGGTAFKTIARLPVFENLEAAAKAAGTHGAHFVACDSHLAAQSAERLLEEASTLGAQVFSIHGHGEAVHLRPWGLHNVLPSSQSHADQAQLSAVFGGRTVLVTGAGGSIGSALCQHLASLSPARIILLDNCEFNLFRIEQALCTSFPQVQRTALLCDIREGESLRRHFERERPDFVLHAAALKHVPIVEAHPCEGVLTNVAGTRHVAIAARAVNACMVFVSTDKAVSPRSIMGATKRIGEMLCQAYDCEGASRMISVRLGNVLGSAGSVAPVFEGQIARGGPVTVTDPAVTRYFITIPRAAEFLLSAAAIGSSYAAPRGGVHVLEMGAPIAVVDLARMMIRLAGKRPDRDIKITFVGLRPGEKISEQLIAEEEQVSHIVSDEIHAVSGPRRDLRALEQEIDRLISLARAGQDERVRSLLHHMVAAIVDPAAIAS